MDSIWEENVQLPRFSALEGDLRTDVLIIGGGLAGLLCAWRLTRAGVACALIEENRIMHGVSGRTTAKVTSQHGCIYGKLLDRFGTEAARLYWQVNEDALAAFRELAREADSDFESQNSYLYATDGEEKLKAEMAAYQKLKIPARWETSLPLPFPVSGAVCLADQAQLHPIKLAAHIAKGLKIFEHTKAVAFLGNRVQTPNGTITAKKTIVATHFPILNKHGAYFLKLYQQRSYVLALENAGPLEGMYLDCAENGLSVRSAGRWLLLGGGGHRTGKQGEKLEVAGAGGKRVFPPGAYWGPLGHTGLYDAGWNALYRPIQQEDTRFICGNRISKVGHEHIHGSGHDPDGSDPGKRESLCCPVFTLPKYAAQAASGQRSGCGASFDPSCNTPMSASRLRFVLE